MNKGEAMTKWADYCIFQVRFNSAHTHIDKVKVYPDNGESLGTPCEFLRGDVISSIGNKVTFVTIFKNSSGEWDKGQPVYVVDIEGKKYIKTVDNDKKVDNLDNLPEF